MIQAWFARHATRFLVWSLMVCMVLGLISWAQWEQSKVAAIEAEIVAETLLHTQEANKRLVVAEKVRTQELNDLRKKYEQSRRDLQSVPDDGCLDRPLPSDVQRLLGAGGKAGDAANARARAAGDAKVPGENVPRSR